MSLDRLTSLLRGLTVVSVQSGPTTGPALWLQEDGEGRRLGLGLDCPSDAQLSAALNWGGGGRALMQAGPFSLCLTHQDGIEALTSLLREEVAAPRCGAPSLLGGYVEALVVHVLRAAIAGHSAGVGLLGGLADLRLARAIVAIHEDPAAALTVEQLADHAGMSRSGFMERFRAVVGQTPMAYLRHWRLDQAREDLGRGDRASEVARRYGYHNPDAFGRAFLARHGVPPGEWRKRAGLLV
jgi:AraC-like DNA-binding protein